MDFLYKIFNCWSGPPADRPIPSPHTEPSSATKLSSKADHTQRTTERWKKDEVDSFTGSDDEEEQWDEWDSKQNNAVLAELQSQEEPLASSSAAASSPSATLARSPAEQRSRRAEKVRTSPPRTRVNVAPVVIPDVDLDQLHDQADDSPPARSHSKLLGKGLRLEPKKFSSAPTDSNNVSAEPLASSATFSPGSPSKSEATVTSKQEKDQTEEETPEIDFFAEMEPTYTAPKTIVLDQVNAQLGKITTSTQTASETMFSATIDDEEVLDIDLEQWNDESDLDLDLDDV
eukprot:CAMPEP_0174239792 /NCGR_PEP_ID=MMETSP0417-20130205/16203_1 /TAXON_ID=242541 /ORGANISM="Mayorella sp, Strain BSH-02190019" /LENGTH=287 /DNA_ID=CAMNT_0015318775 /DNA_START=162 /DNA_END=1021 /DNA_ORIENTATION=-